ncbi:methyltransferase domain-containing protein [Caulobacter sp. SLTY]|uniref:methyltransferase domain-containing protein n=1 Tax=Caulobacter sp. SLTY TaxID=2683262 RepID=UPI00141355BE|nr:methyltransferase domain-containing protein [Caulobacter sp. SLTY]NBB14834.1 methyltransferase domain-containing protein [Caulobacter sp. SLTY]
MPTWDPDIYERYKGYRDRPALDLLLQIPADLDPRTIWDLGCGTGEQAALLARRHPGAKVHGLDSSPQMLAKAAARPEPVTWVQADIAAFDPPQAPDLIFTNAALQWLPNHAALFPRLAAALAPGGVFACQMPTAFETRHHQVLRETAAEGPWAHRTAAARLIQPTPSLDDYYGWLSSSCAMVDIWSTTYLHVLEGQDPVVDWMMGTALRPYLDALPDSDERAAFLAAFTANIGTVFPPREEGVTLFPFPRLFMVARR